MADLILVESPNKVESVTKYAEAVGLAGVKVMGTRGHLIDLPPMNDGLCVDMANWEPTSLVPRDGQAASRLAKIKAAIKEADRVLVATDGDREGEGIAAEVWDEIPAKKAFRCVFEEITPAGVQQGLKNLRGLDRPLVEASKARRLLDRVFGFHASHLTFAKLPGMKTSAGRVQSPTLRLVVDRWKEIQAFKPETYFVLRARLRHTAPDGTAREFEARVLQNGDRLSCKTAGEAETLGLGLPSFLTCSRAEGTEKEQKPRPPFKNSSWLQVAQKALRLPVGKATDAIQSLFEAGSTTYPRTDSVRVSDEAIEWAREEITRRFGAEYLPPKPWVHKDKAGAQGAHEAIRPTVPHGDRTHDAGLEEAFRLIEARFLASQAAARRVRETVLQFPAAVGVILEARGLVELFPGWKKVLQVDVTEEDDDTKGKGEPEEEEAEGSLPPVQQGDQVEVLEVLVDKKTTRPPALFTQATLVAEIERRGIGRPSTFRSMVELILVRVFVQEQAPEADGKKKKAAPIPVLVPTETGIPLCELLVRALPEFLDYAFTARIEEGLEKIETGSLDRPKFLGVIWQRLETALKCADSIQTVRPVRKEFGPCPKCSTEGREGRLVLKKGRVKDTEKTFEFAGCSLDNREAQPCGYRADTDNGELRKAIPCPSCAKPMKAVQRKDKGHSWICEAHGWHLASKSWDLVKPQLCPDCRKAMEHRPRKDGEGHFWGCFPCKKFLDADAFGTIIKPRRKTGPKPKATPAA